MIRYFIYSKALLQLNNLLSVSFFHLTSGCRLWTYVLPLLWIKSTDWRVTHVLALFRVECAYRRLTSRFVRRCRTRYSYQCLSIRQGNAEVLLTFACLLNLDHTIIDTGLEHAVIAAQTRVPTHQLINIYVVSVGYGRAAELRLPISRLVWLWLFDECGKVVSKVLGAT